MLYDFEFRVHVRVQTVVLSDLRAATTANSYHEHCLLFFDDASIRTITRDRRLGCCLDATSPPSVPPTNQPTNNPTPAPTVSPTPDPSALPTSSTTKPEPTVSPTPSPTVSPTPSPSQQFRRLLSRPPPPVDTHGGVPIYPAHASPKSVELPVSSPEYYYSSFKMVSHECMKYLRSGPDAFSRVHVDANAHQAGNYPIDTSSPPQGRHSGVSRN